MKGTANSEAMTRRHFLPLLCATLAHPKLCAQAEPAPVRFERGLMGTRFAVACFHPDPGEAREAADAAFAAAGAINSVASDYIADSELLSLSKHPPGTAIILSPLLFQLLTEARGIAEMTTGFFDPTLGPLTKLWRETRRRRRLPDPATIAAARDACGWQHFHLNAQDLTITLTKPKMRFDLGGIAKGQAADAMLAVMKQRGIARSCITAGGDVRAGEGSWKIGVRTFEGEIENREIFLSNSAVSTSGDLHQSVEIGGVRYSHIIDPATGLGLTRPAAATVIAPSATLSDALATACCVAPRDVALENAKRWGAAKLILPM